MEAAAAGNRRSGRDSGTRVGAAEQPRNGGGGEVVCSWNPRLSSIPVRAHPPARERSPGTGKMEPGGRARSGAPQLAAPGLCRARRASGGGASSWLQLDGHSWLLCYGFLYLALYAQVSQSKPCERTGSCFSGRCVNSTCLCDPGWVGDQCQHCQGRFK